MIEKIDSDSSPTMAASKVFDQILECVKSSNLNFCLQLSPFSANISLKKTLVKDKYGTYLNPRVPDPYLLDKYVREKTELSEKVKDLEIAVDDLQLRLARAYETISEFESNLHIKQEVIDTRQNDHELQIRKKLSEISNLEKEKINLQNQTKTLEASVQKHKTENQDLQRCLQKSRCAAKKLNKEMNESRVNHEKEAKLIIKNFKSEIKSWKKDLGKERSEKIKLERKIVTQDDLIRHYESKIKEAAVEQVSCQTNGSIDIPYLVTEPLPPIFGSQLCYRSKAIPYISKSLPNLSTLSWVCVTAEDLLVDAAEQALNELHDSLIDDFYKNAKAKAEGLRQVYEENCIGNLFE